MDEFADVRNGEKGTEAVLLFEEQTFTFNKEGESSTSAMHTLGCVYAEIGKTKEVREVLVQAMDLLSLDEPDDNYWFAFGGIAEQYGEKQSATSDYRNITKPKKPLQIPTSSYKLAQLRLSALADEKRAQTK